jgi:acyl carrier protein
MNTTFLVVVVILVAAAVLLSDWTTKRRACRHLAGRCSRSSDEFGREFFREHAAVASRIRDILGKHLPIDLAGLCPEDRPVQDLLMDQLDSMSTVEFMIDVEEEFGIEVSDADASKLKTVREIVEYVVRQVDRKT